MPTPTTRAAPVLAATLILLSGCTSQQESATAGGSSLLPSNLGWSFADEAGFVNTDFPDVAWIHARHALVRNPPPGWALNVSVLWDYGLGASDRQPTHSVLYSWFSSDGVPDTSAKPRFWFSWSGASGGQDRFVGAQVASQGTYVDLPDDRLPPLSEVLWGKTRSSTLLEFRTWPSTDAEKQEYENLLDSLEAAGIKNPVWNTLDLEGGADPVNVHVEGSWKGTGFTYTLGFDDDTFAFFPRDFSATAFLGGKITSGYTVAKNLSLTVDLVHDERPVFFFFDPKAYVGLEAEDTKTNASVTEPSGETTWLWNPFPSHRGIVDGRGGWTFNIESSLHAGGSGPVLYGMSFVPAPHFRSNPSEEK